MVPAYSLSIMESELERTLGTHTRTVRKRMRTGSIGLLIAGQPPLPSYDYKYVDEKTEQWSKLVGILFCAPSSKLAKDEVLPNLDYFHHRSALFVDFFCVGYGAYWPTENGADTVQPVARLDGTQWLFGPCEFNMCRHEIQQRTRWQFSGETDLLLAVARKQVDQPASIDFTTAISCNLEAMLRDGAIFSVRAFFEKIFQFGETYKGTDPVWDLSDQFGVSAGSNLLIEAVLSVVPEQVRRAYKSSKHFAISDIST